MRRERSQLPSLIYRLRLLGMALGGIAIAAVLHEQGAPWPEWAWLGFTAVAWPHVAYLVSSRSRDPYRAELRNLLLDSAIAGAWVPLLHFNLLPCVLLVTLTTVDKISSGVPRLWLRSIPGMVAGLLATGLATGFAFAPATSMTVLVACLPIILIHTIAVSLASYRLIRKVTRQNHLLDQLRRTDALTGLYSRGYW
ncbi:MAG TPA: MASE2 domain-containing protein, partial [Xanthomonadaceae bacterium]|nr:MASE2 domain-containing protein [Xanthomonadaceae bacterium]